MLAQNACPHYDIHFGRREIVELEDRKDQGETQNLFGFVQLVKKLVDSRVEDIEGPGPR